MKNSIKKDSFTDFDLSLEDSQEADDNQQLSLDKSVKHHSATPPLTDEVLSQNSASSILATEPDYYSPPAAEHLSAQLPNDRFNHSTWYSLQGRIGRIQLAAFGVIWGLVVVVIFALAFSFGLGLSGRSADWILLTLLILPIFIYSYLVLPKRRLHDLNRSGWWLLLAFIPVVNAIFMIYLYCVGGDKEINDYGLPPEPYTKLQLVLAILFYLFMAVGILAPVFAPSLYTDSLSSEATSIEESIAGQSSNSEHSSSVAEPATQPQPLEADSAVQQVAYDSGNAAAMESQPTTANTDLATDSTPDISFEEFKQQADSQILYEAE